MEPTSPALEGGWVPNHRMADRKSRLLLLNVNVHVMDLGIYFFIFFGLAFITPSSLRCLETGLPHGSLVPPNDVPATATGKLALRQTAARTVQALSHFIPSALDLQASANPCLKNKNPKNPRHHLADWFLAFRITKLLLWLV